LRPGPLFSSYMSRSTGPGPPRDVRREAGCIATPYTKQPRSDRTQAKSRCVHGLFALHNVRSTPSTRGGGHATLLPDFKALPAAHPRTLVLSGTGADSTRRGRLLPAGYVRAYPGAGFALGDGDPRIAHHSATLAAQPNRKTSALAGRCPSARARLTI